MRNRAKKIRAKLFVLRHQPCLFLFLLIPLILQGNRGFPEYRRHHTLLIGVQLIIPDINSHDAVHHLIQADRQVHTSCVREEIRTPPGFPAIFKCQFRRLFLFFGAKARFTGIVRQKYCRFFFRTLSIQKHIPVEKPHKLLRCDLLDLVLTPALFHELIRLVQNTDAKCHARGIPRLRPQSGGHYTGQQSDQQHHAEGNRIAVVIGVKREFRSRKQKIIDHDT